MGTLARALNRGPFCLILCSAVIAAVVAVFTDESVDEAAATIAAAVIGVSGTFLGHAAGVRHVGAKSGESGEKKAVGLAAAVFLPVAIVGVGVVAYVGMSFWPISPAAAASICAATFGVMETEVAHEIWQSDDGFEHMRWLLLGLLTLASVLLVVLLLRAQKVPLGDVATFAGALIAVGGTYCAHPAGRRLARRTHPSGRSQGTRPGEG